MTKIETHPKSGHTIVFDPKWHTYKCVQQPHINFISGTKFLSQFFTPFDRDNISAKYAKKNNLDQAKVLKLWDRKGELGRETGNLIHAYLEARLLDKDLSYEQACKHSDPEIQASAMNKIPHADAALTEVLANYDLIQAEMIVASLTHNIAGMIDILARNKKTGRVSFLDWKTNAKINFSNRWQSGLDPIKHIEDCSYNKYNLQLNLYQRIAVEEKYLIGDDIIDIERVIIHIKTDGYEMIPCHNLQKEIDDMIRSL